MVNTKYGKYFQTYEAKSEDIERGRTGIARVDHNAFEGCNFYWVHWNLPRAASRSADTSGVGHPPHTHKDAEILMLIGTNPDDPTDLGAEVELQMGPEREKHTITKSTVVYIPPNLIHCPYIIKRIDRPWIFIEVNQGPAHTEKLFPQILTEEERKSVDWPRWRAREEGY
jgi:hypothetical protein